MKNIVLFSLVGALFGAVAPVFATDNSKVEAPVIAPDKRNALRDTWHACVAAAIREIDDRVSPASDIATAVQSSCQNEHAEFTRSFNFSPETEYKIYQDRFSSTKELATILVLRMRAQTRAEEAKK